jgi:hypothetical protein
MTLPGTPNLTQVFEAAIDAAKADTRVSLPGVFTAVASNGKTGSVKPAVGPDPVIPDVPILFPQAAGFRMTWPVKTGDPCLLVFGDRSLEEWQSAGGTKAVSPADERRHDLTDAVAIPIGMGGPATGRSNDVSISLGAAEVRLQPGGRVAIGTSSVELIDSLIQLIDGLAGAAFVDGTAAPCLPTPAFAAALLTLSNALTSIRGTL